MTNYKPLFVSLCYFHSTFADEFSENRLHLSNSGELDCIRFALSLHRPDNEEVNEKEKRIYYGTRNEEAICNAGRTATAEPLDDGTGSISTGRTRHGTEGGDGAGTPEQRIDNTPGQWARVFCL